MPVLLRLGHWVGRAGPPHLHDGARLGECLVEDAIGLRLKSTILQLVIILLFFFIKTQNEVLLMLIERFIKPVCGINELLLIERLLQLLQLHEQWLKHFVHLFSQHVHIHFFGGHQTILIIIKLLKDLSHLVPPRLHHNLLTKFAGFALVAHLIKAFMRIHTRLLLLLLYELVPVVKLVGDVAPAGGLSVAQVEGVVYLWFEHLPATLWMNCTLIL